MNYDELKTSITDWALPGGEPLFNSKLDEFIEFAEARFNRELWTHNSIGISDIETDKPFPAVPDDWRGTIQISYNDGSPLKSVTIDQRQAALYGVGKPWGYCATDGGFRLVPAPNAVFAFELVYYRKIKPLGTDNQSNWLLALAPDLYLTTALAFAAAFLQNDEDLTKYASVSKGMIDTMNEATIDQEQARGQPLVRVLTFG